MAVSGNMMMKHRALSELADRLIAITRTMLLRGLKRYIRKSTQDMNIHTFRDSHKFTLRTEFNKLVVCPKTPGYACTALRFIFIISVCLVFYVFRKQSQEWMETNSN